MKFTVLLVRGKIFLTLIIPYLYHNKCWIINLVISTFLERELLLFYKKCELSYIATHDNTKIVIYVIFLTSSKKKNSLKDIKERKAMMTPLRTYSRIDQNLQICASNLACICLSFTNSKRERFLCIQ